MKRISFLAFVLSISAVTTYAQKSVLFKFKYSPGRTYTMNSKMDMNTDMAIKADSTSANPANASSVHAQMNVHELMRGAAKTAKSTTSADLPFTLSCDNYSIATEAKINGKETSIPANNSLNGQVLNGTIDKDGKMAVDTSAENNAGVKSGSSSLLREMRPQIINFPDKEMKIGDTFTQEEPMTDIDLTNMGVTKAANVKVTYKLTAIKGNLAYFDTESTFNMDINEHKDRLTVTGKGNGSGAGKMVYNIAGNYPQSRTNNVSVAINIDGKSTKPASLKADIKVKKNIDVEYLVSAN